MLKIYVKGPGLIFKGIIRDGIARNDSFADGAVAGQELPLEFEPSINPKYKS